MDCGAGEKTYSILQSFNSALSQNEVVCLSWLNSKNMQPYSSHSATQ